MLVFKLGRRDEWIDNFNFKRTVELYPVGRIRKDKPLVLLPFGGIVYRKCNLFMRAPLNTVMAS